MFGLIFTFAALVDTTQPYHDIRQLADGTTIVTNTSGVLLPAYGGTGVSTCANNQVLKWSGSAWVCGTDAGGISGSESNSAIEFCKDNGIACMGFVESPCFCL